MHRDIIAELHAIADIRGDEEEPELQAEAVAMRHAAEILEAGESLSDAELELVIDELLSWQSKDAWSAGKPRRMLLAALAELGGLDEYRPAAVWSRRPKTWSYRGKRYIVG